MRKREILSYIFLIIFLILLSFISGIWWLAEAMISIAIYNLITFGVYLIWKLVTKKNKMNFIDFSRIFIYRLSLLLFILVTLIWWFAFYQNDLNPAKMPIYTISNSQKTVIFQNMSHIWSQNFYDSVIENIRKYKKEKFVLFYEGVRPWKEESMKDFDNALWVQFDEDLYENFSKLYWVVYQNNEDLLWLVNNLDFNIDLGIDEIMEIYKEKSHKNNNNVSIQSKEAIDLSQEIVSALSELSPRELSVLRYVNKSIINFMIKNDGFRDTLIENMWNTSLFDVILDDRNKNLAKEIEDSEYNKIIVTYWLMHFDWVFSILKNNDNNWRIIKTDYIYLTK